MNIKLTTAYPNLIGLDKFFSDVESFLNIDSGNYPPYNIISESDNIRKLEISVAGFKRDEIEITHEGKCLTVSGHKQKPSENRQYLHRGIATRQFSRKFVLADNVIVKDAEIIDGILSITLEILIPEDKKPKTIQIR